MHAFAAWSINLGRWGGIHVRLHILFILFAVCALYLGTGQPGSRLGGGGADREMLWLSAMALGILFVSVLVHELAHCYVVRRAEGRADEIVIGPLGGLAERGVLRQPQLELAAALAGPLVNLGLVMLAAPLLILLTRLNPVVLLHPLAPRDIGSGSPLVIALKLTVWLNGVLAMVNLLPTYPFDGGRALRAILWPHLGYRTSVIIVARIARFSALMILLAAWLVGDWQPGSVVPAWVPLVLLAIFIYFSANQDVARLDDPQRHGDALDDEFGSGFTSVAREDESLVGEQQGVLERWLEKRRLAKDAQRRQQEMAEEARLDSILARLHEAGMDRLPAEDRALLRRVSARYRNRLKP